MIPTPQQRKIIEAPGTLVIIANPGSGKTFVLSEKIKKILPETLEIKGVIAISYTNKASNELKKRCLKNGLDPKSSFFGTMDKFYLSEIIVPFAKQLFGLPKTVINVVRKNDLNKNTQENLNWLEDSFDLENLPNENIIFLKNLFLDGQIVLESVGLLSIYIFNKSLACRNYLRSRYTHIIIDEYQDSGKEQHLLFLKIKELGLSAIAVGDANQSIFKFSGKSSEYLIDLARRKNEFKLFPLDFNHRCHPSITNYSLLLLNEKSELLPCNEIHIFEKQIQGNEVKIAEWLSSAILSYKQIYAIDQFNKVAILVRNSRTGTIIHKNIELPHKFFHPTPLDDDLTIWSGIFRELLFTLFDSSRSKSEFVGNYISVEANRTKAITILKQITELERKVNQASYDVVDILNLFEMISFALHSTGKNEKSIKLLREVLSNSNLLDSYKPAEENEVQIMSLHKSKGLEFDMVFHLDLYEWILPKKEFNAHETLFSDIVQDINLHYVGITRAKKCCVLCYSSMRTNYKNEQKKGSASEFLQLKILYSRRKKSTF
ncbi:MAG: UvrD-helicase domain-containing protein [Ginsengibacter sp.]